MAFATISEKIKAEAQVVTPARLNPIFASNPQSRQLSHSLLILDGVASNSMCDGRFDSPVDPVAQFVYLPSLSLHPIPPISGTDLAAYLSPSPATLTPAATNLFLTAALDVFLHFTPPPIPFHLRVIPYKSHMSDQVYRGSCPHRQRYRSLSVTPSSCCIFKIFTTVGLGRYTHIRDDTYQNHLVRETELLCYGHEYFPISLFGGNPSIIVRQPICRMTLTLVRRR